MTALAVAVLAVSASGTAQAQSWRELIFGSEAETAAEEATPAPAGTAAETAGDEARAQTRMALVIGNAAYDDMSSLANPVRDAKAMAEVLRGYGIEVVAGYDLTIGEFHTLLSRFRHRARSADVVFLYYAGHGLQSEGRDVIAPVDVTYQCPEGGGTATIYGGIALKQVLAGLGKETATQVVMIDACRNRPFKRCPKNRSTTGLSFSFRGLGRLGGVSRSLMLANATQPGGLAADGPTGQHSPFNSALRSAFKAHPKAPLRDVLDRASARVKRETEGVQIPQVTTNGGAPLLCLAAEGCGSRPAATNRLEADYRRAERIGTKEAWQVFLARHGENTDSFYVQLAEAALKKLAVGVYPGQPEAQSDTCDGVEVDLASGGTKCIKPGSGESFKDCADCPEMVVVPAGRFLMGSPKSEEGRYDDEGPQHEVRIPKPFAVGKFEVTWDEWEACVAAGDCDGKGVEEAGGDNGWGKGEHPVINVSWNDAQAYAKWLSAKTGKSYRLLSEAEWEYAARAETTGPFSFDGPITTDKANYEGNDSYAGSPEGEYRKQTVPVDSFQPNPWGLYQVHGNVWEWVEDCWNESYGEKPDSLKASGGAWTSGNCDRRVLRGGSWFYNPQDLRSANRYRFIRDGRIGSYGFRLARTITP